MAKLSVSETTTFRWSFEEDVKNYAGAGIPSMGVWRQKLSDCEEARAISLLREHGLEVSHLFWAGGFTGSDGRSFRESVEDAQEALRLAKRLGAGCLLVYTGTRAGHTYNHARRLVRDALLELVPLAENLDLAIAIEPMHPACAGSWTFLTTLEETLMVLDMVGSPRVKMVFDTYHLGHSEGIVERIKELVPRVALVQLGDTRTTPTIEGNRCRLGEGTLPLADMIASFASAGYDGYYDVELLGEEFSQADYPSVLLHAKESFARLVGGAKADSEGEPSSSVKPIF
ncbi:MAG TPA: sugar phosphate isomerase/epimerase family protein [Thermoguttaceae bacterium]|nr:sugar phosphate isomerase/epimerase family protein [Thermoguttaceae bacterium]HPP52913.1 sugar phosphate isomerase/epimerase family protein [Thermoguttaceae bacterium]